MNHQSRFDTGSLGLVHWDDPEGWYGEGGGRGLFCEAFSIESPSLCPYFVLIISNFAPNWPSILYYCCYCC